ncbi:MAG: hypothetical protein ABI921_00095, partial [Panacibacter sp.]
GASVIVNGHKIAARENPLGEVDGIPDARELSLDGKSGPAQIEVDGVKIIGTGSPAQLPKELWLP